MPTGMPVGIGLIAENEIGFCTLPRTVKLKEILANRRTRKLVLGRIEDQPLRVNASGNIKSP